MALRGDNESYHQYLYNKVVESGFGIIWNQINLIMIIRKIYC